MSLWLLQGLQFMPEVLAGSNSRKSFVVEPTVGTSTEKLIFEPGEVLVSRPFASVITDAAGAERDDARGVSGEARSGDGIVALHSDRDRCGVGHDRQGCGSRNDRRR
jgi:hypothetical protein